MPGSPLDLNTRTCDRIIRLIQRQLGDKIRIPFELQLRGGRTYRFGNGEPSVSFMVNDRNGLAALCSFDELRFCEACMSGSLYLWGSAYAFFSHGLEAFRVVLERPLLPDG